MARPTEIGGLVSRAPLRDAGLGLLLARLFDVRRRELAVFERMDVDGVHDLRVATRRLRAALRLFGKKPLRRTEPEVELLQDALGDVRDLHVLREWIATGPARGPEREALAAIDRELGHRLLAAERALLLALKRWVEVGAPSVERAALSVRGGDTLRGAKTTSRLEQALRKLEHARDALLASRSPEVLHAFRLRLKKFRYLAELPGPALAPHLKGRLEEAAAIQDVVGAVHDLDVRIDLLRRPSWSLPTLSAQLQSERDRRSRDVQRSLGAMLFR